MASNRFRNTSIIASHLQAKTLGDVLVVGLVPDSEIQRCKGPPVMNEAERYTMVESVKWVDEVITGAHMLSVNSNKNDVIFTESVIFVQNPLRLRGK